MKVGSLGTATCFLTLLTTSSIQSNVENELKLKIDNILPKAEIKILNKLKSETEIETLNALKLKMENIVLGDELSVSFNSIELQKILNCPNSWTYEKNREEIKLISSEEILEKHLKNTKYNWRTIKGLVKETEIPPKIVSETLLNMAKKKKVFIGVKKNGEKIYSLIEEYEKNTKFLIKLKDAITGKIIR